MKANLATIEAYTICENEESYARIAALQSEGITVAIAKIQVDEKNSIGDIFLAILLVASKYSSLSKVRIIHIFSNKF